MLAELSFVKAVSIICSVKSFNTEPFLLIELDWDFSVIVFHFAHI